jgi:RNA polymerase sigma-70 factor, ECF subfamily
VPANDREYRLGGRPHSGSFSPAVSQNQHVPRGVCLFNLAASDVGQPVVPLDEATEGEEEGSIKKEPGAPDERLAGSIDRLVLQRAVDELPPGYRTIFVLHDVEGYEHNEIAELVGCSIGNSKSQLHKARIKLRELLRMSRAEKAAKR